MNLPAEFHNLAAYVLQVALLVLTGALLPKVFRIRLPGVLLIYWQLLLIACLALPLVAPRQIVPSPATEVPAVTQLLQSWVAAPQQMPSRGQAVNWIAISRQAALIVLAAGCALRLGWLAMGLLKLRLLRRNARLLETLPPGMENLASLAGSAPEIFISPDVPGPATCGFVRPTILLPETYEAMDAGSQISILCHELMHVRRRDWLFALWEQLILALFWFHPAVWWLIYRIELTREQLVDQEVLSLSVDRRQYLKSLLYTAGGRSAVLSANLFLTRHHLKERIKLLLEEVHMSRKRVAASLMLMSMLFAVGTVAVARMFPLTGLAVSAPPAMFATPAPKPAVSAAPPSAIAPAVPKTAVSARQAKVVPIAPTRAPDPNKVATPQSSVSGLVVDAKGIFLPGVNVRVTDPKTGNIVATGISDDRGTVSLVVLFQGHADFTFLLEGFKQSIIKSMVLGPAPVTFKATMQPDGGNYSLEIHPGGLVSASEQAGLSSGRVKPATVIKKTDPVYPPEAMQEGTEAVVILEALVAEDGTVTGVRIVKGHQLFDEAAMNAVREWRYSPALLNGQPYPCRVTVTFVFKR